MVRKEGRKEGNEGNECKDIEEGNKKRRKEGRGRGKKERKGRKEGYAGT